MGDSKLKGFTLIELIVVMAIIGVLAAILVPSMIGYLNDSKFSKANANAKQVYQSAANWATKCETNSKPCATALTIGEGNGYDLTTVGKKNEDVEFDGSSSTDLETALLVYMGGNPNSGVCCTTVENSAPLFGQWAGSADETTTIWGEYPTEVNANKIAKSSFAWGSSNASNVSA